MYFNWTSIPTHPLVYSVALNNYYWPYLNKMLTPVNLILSRNINSLLRVFASNIKSLRNFFSDHIHSTMRWKSDEVDHVMSDDHREETWCRVWWTVQIRGSFCFGDDDDYERVVQRVVNSTATVILLFWWWWLWMGGAAQMRSGNMTLGAMTWGERSTSMRFEVPMNAMNVERRSGWRYLKSNHS